MTRPVVVLGRMSSFGGPSAQPVNDDDLVGDNVPGLPRG